MDTAINGANLIIYIGFGIISAMFWLFKQALDEKFKAVEKRLDDLKEESKSDDKDVRAEIAKVDSLRVDQITKLHERVGVAEKDHCGNAQRIARLESKHE